MLRHSIFVAVVAAALYCSSPSSQGKTEGLVKAPHPLSRPMEASGFSAELPNGVHVRVLAVSKADTRPVRVWEPDGSPATQEQMDLVKSFLDAAWVGEPTINPVKGDETYVWMELKGYGDVWSAICKVRAEPDLYGSGSKGSHFGMMPRFRIEGQWDWLRGTKFRGLGADTAGDLTVGIASGDPEPISTKGLKIGQIRTEDKPSGDSSVGTVHRPLYRCSVDVVVPPDQVGRDLHIEGYDAAGARIADNDAAFFAPSETGANRWPPKKTRRRFLFASYKPVRVVSVKVTARDIQWVTFKGLHLKAMLTR